MMIKYHDDEIDDINLLLAEKRTSLAVLRTAIAIFTLPLSVFTILTATSRYYNPLESFHLFLPLLLINFLLIIIGVYLIFRSFRKIKKIDSMIEKLKRDFFKK
jgi:uncharacterized membrane protein YidH (DUF202 family)